MSNRYYPNLFEPLTIRGKTIKNRIVSAPQSCPYMLTPGENGFFNYSEDAAMYYANIARGGAGIVNTGHLGVDPRYYLGGNRLYFNFFSPLLRWHQLPNMRRMTAMIHAHGALASMELNHGGYFSTPLSGNEVPGPCAKALNNGRTARGIDEEEMNQIADYFADAAEVGVQGGFDIINVHAGHNWLLGQFFSPVENKRLDRYGGSVENRARFPRMVLERIRRRVDDRMILEIRFSASELCEGGYGIDEAIETIRCLEDVIDIVQCSVGRIDDPYTEAYTFPTQYAEHGCNVYLAQKMRQKVSIPVETIGGINDPGMAEEIVRSGAADFVGMARSFIADPNWAEKARRGRPEDIRPCIRCVRCMDSNERTGVGECTVNPRRILYREFPRELPEAQKRIAVVGGGPAGLQAAFELGQKGHEVTLYEAGDRLGGRLSFADHIAFKEDIRRYREYLIAQVKKCPRVTVHLNVKATPEFLLDKDYDAVVAAVGAEPVNPPISGIDSQNVIFAADLFGRENELGEHITIIGGGQIGCETAIHLASLGKIIRIVEMDGELMKDSVDLQDEAFVTQFYLRHRYNRKDRSLTGIEESDQIQVMLNAKCVEILPGSAVIESGGVREPFRADHVIVAAGFRPDEDLKRRFSDTAADVLFIGDCDRVGGLKNTSAGGYYASLRL